MPRAASRSATAIDPSPGRSGGRRSGGRRRGPARPAVLQAALQRGLPVGGQRRGVVGLARRFQALGQAATSVAGARRGRRRRPRCRAPRRSGRAIRPRSAAARPRAAARLDRARRAEAPGSWRASRVLGRAAGVGRRHALGDVHGDDHAAPDGLAERPARRSARTGRRPAPPPPAAAGPAAPGPPAARRAAAPRGRGPRAAPAPRAPAASQNPHRATPARINRRPSPRPKLMANILIGPPSPGEDASRPRFLSAPRRPVPPAWEPAKAAPRGPSLDRRSRAHRPGECRPRSGG